MHEDGPEGAEGMKDFIICTVSFFALLFGLGGLDGCGPFKVEHDVSGTVQVQVQVPAAAYEPFFLTDCQARTAGQQCYNADPAVCASCMASALAATLPK